MFFLTILFVFFVATFAQKCEQENSELTKLQSNATNELPSKRAEFDTCMEDYFATKNSYTGAVCTSTYTEILKMERILEKEQVDCSKVYSRAQEPHEKIEETPTLSPNQRHSYACAEPSELCKLERACEVENTEFARIYNSYKTSMDVYNQCEENHDNTPFMFYMHSQYSCNDELFKYADNKLVLMKHSESRKMCTKLEDYRKVGQNSKCEIANLELTIQQNHVHTKLPAIREKLQKCREKYRDTIGGSENCRSKIDQVSGLENVLTQRTVNCSTVQQEAWNFTSFLNCVRQRTQDILNERPIYLGELCERLNPDLYSPEDPRCEERNEALLKAQEHARELVDLYKQDVEYCWKSDEKPWKCPKLQLVLVGMERTLDKKLEEC